MPRPHGPQSSSWWSTTVPPTGPNGTTATYVGALISFDVPGRLFGFRLYRETTAGPPHWAIFSDNTTGLLIASKAFFHDTPGASGWQQAWLKPSFRIDTAAVYRLAILYPIGRFFRTNNALPAGGTGTAHINIRFRWGFQSNVLDIVSAAPAVNQNANGVDVLFQPD
jgi:hypothetical protein